MGYIYNYRVIFWFSVYSVILTFSLNKPELDLALYKERSYANLTYDVKEDYNSISYNARPKEDEVGSSSFISKTKRGLSISNLPGPGSYNLNYKHEIIRNAGK